MTKACIFQCMKQSIDTGPATPPRNVTTMALSSTSINVSWDEIPLFNRNGIIVTYEVVFVPLNTFDGQVSRGARNTSELSILLNGLEEYLDYNITVSGYTSAGPSPSSDVVTEMTPEDGKCL